MNAIKESDWKRLSKLRPIALERFCSRALTEIEHIQREPVTTSHEKYLAIYDVIHARDREIASIFNRNSRSYAHSTILRMQRFGLLTDEEIAGFNEEIRGCLATVDRDED